MFQSIAALILVACIAGSLGWDFGGSGSYIEPSGTSWSQPGQYDSYGGSGGNLQPSFDQGSGHGDSSGSWLQPGGASWSQPSNNQFDNSYGGNGGDQFAGQGQGLGDSGLLQPGGSSWSQPDNSYGGSNSGASALGSSSGQGQGVVDSGSSWQQPNQAPAQAAQPTGHSSRLSPECVERIREYVQNKASIAELVQLALSPLCYRPEDWM